MEGNLRFKIDGASLIVEGKFTVFALFYFLFEGNIPSTSPRGAYIWRGDLTEGFLRYRFGGLIFGGAYKWRGLFSELYGNYSCRYFLLCFFPQPLPRPLHFSNGPSVKLPSESTAFSARNFQHLDS